MQPRINDFVGDFDSIGEAKRAVDTRQPDGFNVHENGAVLDTMTGEVRDWASAIGAFQDDHWYAPRHIGEV